MLLGVLSLSAAYLFLAVQQYRAWAWAQSDQVAGVARAVALRPRSAPYREKLGSLLFYSQGNPAPAARQFQIATQLEPDAARPWLLLAGADFSQGDLPGFRAALERATELDPTTPDLSWQAANYWLSSGDTERALRALHTALLYDSSQLPRAAQISWQATHDVDRVLQAALPATPEAYAALLAALTREPDPRPAERAWSALVGLHQPLPPSSVFSYVDYLLQHGRSAEAQRAWRQMLQLDSMGAMLNPPSLVTDGGFEGDSLDPGGFFWRIADHAGVEAEVDGEIAHSGSRSLLLTFDHASGADLGISQVVPVQPATRYTLSGFARGEGLLTAYGPRLVVLDHFTGQTLAASDEVIGTAGWRELTAAFLTPPDTDAVELRLQRSGAGVISGKFWLDDVSLVQP